MTIEDLQQIHIRYRKEKPKLFDLSATAPPCTEQQIESLERAIKVSLPQSYRQFLNTFGGGNFGLVVIFSADPSDEWYLPRKQREMGSYLPKDLLPFSDDFAGGCYTFRTTNGHAQEPIIYWNRDGGEVATELNNIIEFVARYAYEAA